MILYKNEINQYQYCHITNELIKDCFEKLFKLRSLPKNREDRITIDLRTSLKERWIGFMYRD